MIDGRAGKIIVVHGIKLTTNIAVPHRLKTNHLSIEIEVILEQHIDTVNITVKEMR